MKTNTEKWHKRFLSMAKEVASWSKDPSTQVGAIAVDDNRRILSQGYNGFPRGMADSWWRYKDREQKYKYIVHAEMNLIYNASYNGVTLNGSTIYVTGLPVCSECAKGLIQVGAKKIVIGLFTPFDEQPDTWKKSWDTTRGMFEEVGIKYEIYYLH